VGAPAVAPDTSPGHVWQGSPGGGWWGGWAPYGGLTVVPNRAGAGRASEVHQAVDRAAESAHDRRMSDVTFRDFAGAAMRGDTATAAAVLRTLLGLGPEQAVAATEYFRGRMADPAFLPKAMGLRTAVTSGTDAQIAALLEESFGLDAASRDAAVATLRTRYPAPAP